LDDDPVDPDKDVVLRCIMSLACRWSCYFLLLLVLQTETQIAARTAIHCRQYASHTQTRLHHAVRPDRSAIILCLLIDGTELAHSALPSD
jgi:hypothetical protein